MKVVLERDFDAVGREAWDRLAQSSTQSTIFQSWGWHRAWWRAYRDHAGTHRELALMCVRDDDEGRLHALAPLLIERHGARRTLKFIGEGRSGCADFLCADETPEACQSILDGIAEHADLWDVLEFTPVLHGSAAATLITGWAARRGLSATSQPTTSQTVLQLRPDAPSHGPRVDFEAMLSTEAAEIAGVLTAFFLQHVHRWSSDRVQSHFLERATRDFYRYLTDELPPSGQLLFVTMSTGGTPVACAFGASSGGGVLWCDPSFDVDAPGRRPDGALLDAMSRFGREHGLTELVFARDPVATPPTAPLEKRACLAIRVVKERPSALARFVSRSMLTRRALDVAAEVRQVASAAFGARKIVDERRQRASLAASHRDFYDAGYNTRQYLREIRLQRPEQVILAELRPAMRAMRVLDVGVGAGRTVPYFGTGARSYSGFDFAPNMVAACRQIVGDLVDPATISTGDARDMTAVADASCDLVLISYNAIDDIGGEEDRFKVLAEVRRVAKPGGWFCFSSHNMRSLTASGAVGLVPRLRRWRRYRLLRAANPGLHALRHASTGMINDPGMDYRFPHYYIAPSAQARQLQDFGFSGVRVFSVDTGQEIADPARWDDLVDSWVYYLCRA